MKLLKRTISLDDLKTKQEGLSYGIFTATSIYMKINLIQTIDDMGIVTNLPFERFGYPCRTLTGSIATTNITCYNGIGTPPTSGELTAVPSGGVEPYTYQWSNGGIDATISNLGPGIYDVIITDSEGCQITLRGIVNVTESANPELMGQFGDNQYYRIPSSQGGYQEISPNGYIVSGQELNLNSLTVPYNTNTIILCTGQKITLSTSIPYSSYSWNTGSDTPTIQIEEAGTYTVNVIGSDGCEGTSSITIEYINIPEPKFEFNKPHKSGNGTIDDPYVFCTNQYPVLLTLANSPYFDTWTWNTGVSDIVSIVPSNTPLASYGFNNSGYISSICCPVGTPNCQQIQTPLIWIRYSNLSADGCGIESIEGVGVSG